jgi:hypothetical protein
VNCISDDGERWRLIEFGDESSQMEEDKSSVSPKEQVHGPNRSGTFLHVEGSV